MKKGIGVFVLLLCAAGFVFADPVEGYWLSVDDKTAQVTAGWELYVENGKLYGKMLSATQNAETKKAAKCKAGYAGFPVQGDVRQMAILGTPWIFGLKAENPGQWSGGYVVNPETGDLYTCKITFHAADGSKFTNDTLEMRGALRGPFPIGRSQFWRKAGEREARSVR
jgi:uncharacterized protein (DUF2147 family)